MAGKETAMVEFFELMRNPVTAISITVVGIGVIAALASFYEWLTGKKIL